MKTTPNSLKGALSSRRRPRANPHLDGTWMTKPMFRLGLIRMLTPNRMRRISFSSKVQFQRWDTVQASQASTPRWLRRSQSMVMIYKLGKRLLISHSLSSLPKLWRKPIGLKNQVNCSSLMSKNPITRSRAEMALLAMSVVRGGKIRCSSTRKWRNLGSKIKKSII